MILTHEQITEMTELSKPIIKWLNENADPHCKIIIDTGSVEIVSGVAAVPVLEFIQD